MGILRQRILGAPFSRQDLCFLFARCHGGATNLRPPCVTLLAWGFLDYVGV